MARNGKPVGRGQSGFTLIELIIVVAVVGILALWGVPSFLSTLNRARLTGASREVATLMQVARLEAIKKGGMNGNLNNFVTAVAYEWDPDGAGGVPPIERSFRVVIDDSPDGTWNPATPVGGPYILPTGVSLVAPSGASAIDVWNDASNPNQFPGPIFLSDGSARLAGAFRLADTNSNFLEVRVDFPATSKVVIQKWFGGDLNDWWENHEENHIWQW